MSTPSLNSVPPTMTCSGTTWIECASTSDPGRYAVESVTIAMLTCAGYRWASSAQRSSHGDDVDELGSSHDHRADAALGRREHLGQREHLLSQGVLADVGRHVEAV